MAGEARPDSRRGPAADPQSSALPQGNRRAHPEMGSPRSLDLRDGRLAPDAADLHDEPGLTRNPQGAAQAGERPLRDGGADRRGSPPQIPGDPLESTLRRSPSAGFDPAGPPYVLQEERASLPRADVGVSGPWRPLCRRSA